MNATKSREAKRSNNMIGWVFFAAFMMGISGFFQAIVGLVAILKHTYYFLSVNHEVAFSYATWGWIHLVFGVILILSAGSLLQGHVWGRLLGITLVGLNLIANFTYIPSYPFWAFTIIILDTIIIYAIALHGDEIEA